MRIGHFYRDYQDKGGAPRDAIQLMDSMKKYVDEAFMYCYTTDPDKVGDEVQDNLTIRTFYLPESSKNKNPLYIESRLKEILEKNTDQIDIAFITAGFIPENIKVANTLKDNNIPYILVPHESYNPNTFGGIKGLRKKVYEKLFETNIVKNANGFRLHAPIQKQHMLMRDYQINGDCFYIDEGIDWEGIYEQLPDFKTPTLSTELHFGFLGRIVIYKKGLDLLVKGWDIYKREGGQGRLSIVGPADPKQKEAIHGLYQSLKTPDLEFSDGRFGPDKYYFMQSLAAFIHSSRSEGAVTRAIRESFAMGCPAILTENTSGAQLLRDYNAGVVIDTSAEGVAEGLHKFSEIWHDPEKREKMNEGVRQVVKVLDWDVTARKYVENAKRILNK